jgi:hypothetical protein
MSAPANHNDPHGVDVDEKIHGDQIEDANQKYEEHALAVMPESLRNLSEAERNAIERKMVRKMDLIIL